MTQNEVALRSGGSFSAAALSQIERGHSQPSRESLDAIAKVTEIPVAYFIRRSGEEEREGFFRSLRSTSALDRRTHLAQASLLHEFCVALEEFVRLPELTLPRLGDRSGPDAIERAARMTRNAWGISPGPVTHVVRELERNGIVVVRQRGFSREVDAFSVRYADRPVVVLGSNKGVTTRSRFDAAHELAHLILHDDADAGTKLAEQEAHEFAAAFLMPADEIRDELPRSVDWSALMHLKVRWRVSIAALLRRARTLDVIGEHQYVNALKAMSARGWRTEEPGDIHVGALESPVLLTRALDVLSEHGYSVEDVARTAGLPSQDIRQIIEDARDPRPQVEI
jgi:Zn-dependent peptidase ImmA (M78 family)/transcriptional regulator with XRE-family HTH domain